jgi:PKD repeat protein
METNVSRSYMKLRLLVAAVTVVGLTGCSLSDQSAPGFTGPSTLARSVIVTATPDRILFDGTSQATITADVRKADGSSEAGVAVRWEAAVTQVVNGTQTVTPIPVEPSPQVSTTGSNGRTTTVVRAPVAPDVMPSGMVMLTVWAVPLGDDAAQLAPGIDAKPRSVTVELVPVLGSNSPNRLPVPDFTISPPAANIFQSVTFDASLTRDEGVVCGDRCSYVWEFRYGTPLNLVTKSGRIVSQSFPAPGPVSVKLYVTDERLGTSTKETTISINGPAAPVAAFVVTPNPPTQGVQAVFDASSSTVGTGSTIVTYSWDFGDGSPNVTGKVQTHTFAVAQPYPVTLTVTDDLGRTSTKTIAVIVEVP